MRCSNCGSELSPGVRFCSHCGAPQPAFAPPQPAIPKAKKRWPWVVLAIGSLFALLCVCTAGVVFFFSLPLGPSQPIAVPSTAPEGAIAQTIGPQGGETVGPQGGEVSGPEGMKIIVPPGALVAEVPLSVNLVETPPTVPAEYQMVPAGLAYQVVVPEGLELLYPVEILLPVVRTAGADESLYTVLHWRDGGWVDLGGLLEGDFIRTRTERLSLFQPVRGSSTRKPRQFVCDYRFDANIYTWGYRPLYVGVTPPFPAASATCLVHQRLPRPSMMLPLGVYTFCVEYYVTVDKTWYYYIRTILEGVNDTDPDMVDVAKMIGIDTGKPVPPARRGRCGDAPGRGQLLPGGAVATPRVTPSPGRTPTPTSVRPTPTATATHVPPTPPPIAFTGVIEYTEYGDGDHYYVEISDGIVVGGYDQGACLWDAVDGIYDGTNLQVRFVTDEQRCPQAVATAGPCGAQQIHYYRVEATQLFLLRYTICDVTKTSDKVFQRIR